MSQPSLDLTDIQGNILLGYGLPFGCYMFFEINDQNGMEARQSLARLIPEVTTSGWWRDKPDQTFNIAFSHPGLKKLELPAESLAGFPVDFEEGLLKRSVSLNNVRKNDPKNWEEFWRTSSVDVWMSVNAKSEELRDAQVQKLLELIGFNFAHKGSLAGKTCLEANDVNLLKKIGAKFDFKTDPEEQRTQAEQLYFAAQVNKEFGGMKLLDMQLAGSLVIDGKRTHKEHFGYSDAIGNPDIEGSGISPRPGRGTPAESGQWKPVKTGEFLLGHVDESEAVPPAPEPNILSRNGSYLVYLKLHQNVQAFRDFIDKQAEKYPGGKELFRAKLIGRWDDGTPLALSPHQPNPGLVKDPMRNNDFGYMDDQDGARVPLGAHIRRMNPRDTFGFGGRLASRHRIARRGLPFGEWVPYDQKADDSIERGVNFMAVNTSIDRQFEFVWKQWGNYGNDFSQGNDRDPILGNHDGKGGMVIPGDPDRVHEQPTHIISDIPQFVELRGGGYFFLPSLTALRLIAEGTIVEHLSTYDPATVPVEHKVKVPDRPRLPNHEPPPPEEIVNRSFLKWLGSLPAVLLSPLTSRIKAWVENNPLSFYWFLRTFRPVLIKGNTAIISRYEDVVEVLNAKDTFYVTYGPKMGRITDGGEFYLGLQPGPKYDQDIKNVRAAIRFPQDIATILRIAKEEARPVFKKANGRLNVVELGYQIPTRLTWDFFGLKPTKLKDQDYAAYAKRASRMFRYLFSIEDPKKVDIAALDKKALEAAGITREQIDDVIAERKKAGAQKHDDMLGRLLELQSKSKDIEADRLQDFQIRNNMVGLLIGMIQSTSKCAAQALNQLLDRPKELAAAQAAARSDNDELLAKYVFEALRFQPNNPGLIRKAARDVQFRGKLLPHGMKVVPLTWSAMFDNRVVDQPNRFKLNRPPEHYLHFGVGMHRCTGEGISYLQIPAVLKPVLQQTNLRRAEGDPGKLQMAGPFPSSLVVEFDVPNAD